MKGALIVAGLIFLGACGITDAVMVGKNLLPNESFENRPGFKDENPREWGSWNSDYNGLALTVKRRGQQSVYITCPKQGEATGVFYTYKEVKPGDRYTFSCYALNSFEDPIKGDAYGQISIEWRKKTLGADYRDTIVEISRDYGPKFGPELSTMKWTLFTMSAVAPYDADNCNFVIQFFNKGGGSGKFFADDVSAEKADKDIALKDYVLRRSPKKTGGGSTLKSGTSGSGSRTGASSAPSESFPATLVIADFDSGKVPNNVGGEFETWNKDPNDATQVCNINFNPEIRHGDKGFSLQIDYDVDSPSSAYNGLWMKLQDRDISRYSNLTFWIKGDEAAGFSSKIGLELRDSKGEIGRYTLSDITKDWQEVSIPIKEFSGLADAGSVSEFMIVFDDMTCSDKKQGTIYIDDITFVK